MLAIQACIIDPTWDEVHDLSPPRAVAHPLGCHRSHVPERLVFDKLVQALVFGCAYEHIADATCSATNLHGIYRERFEFQMLFGIRPQLQREPVAREYRVLVATPFGPDWYPY